MTSAYKICGRGHFEFFSTSNIISLHSPCTYKLSMIRFVHKVHIDVEFQLTHRLYAFPDSMTTLGQRSILVIVTPLGQRCKLTLAQR